MPNRATAKAPSATIRMTTSPNAAKIVHANHLDNPDTLANSGPTGAANTIRHVESASRTGWERVPIFVGIEVAVPCLSPAWW